MCSATIAAIADLACFTIIPLLILFAMVVVQMDLDLGSRVVVI